MNEIDKLERLQLFLTDIVAAYKLPAMKVKDKKKQDEFIKTQKPAIKAHIENFLEEWVK